MAELTTESVRSEFLQQYRDGSLSAASAAADFDAWHRKELAKAWAEGFDAGEIDAFDADRPGHTCTPNPYKEA